MDKYPTLDALIVGMKNNIGVTSGWDLIVSYSVDKLNTLLGDIWTAKKATTNVTVRTTDIDHRDRPPSTYHTEFNLQISAPTLQFDPAGGGRAVLVMNLNGNFHVVEPMRNGDTDPGTELELDKYELRVTVPIKAVSARATDSGFQDVKHEVSAYI
jgi:hypothetical protein